jgi:hypothetical protein
MHLLAATTLADGPLDKLAVPQIETPDHFGRNKNIGGMLGVIPLWIPQKTKTLARNLNDPAPREKFLWSGGRKITPSLMAMRLRMVPLTTRPVGVARISMLLMAPSPPATFVPTALTILLPILTTPFLRALLVWMALLLTVMPALMSGILVRLRGKGRRRRALRRRRQPVLQSSSTNFCSLLRVRCDRQGCGLPRLLHLFCNMKRDVNGIGLASRFTDLSGLNAIQTALIL